MAVPLSEEVVEFLASGVDACVATRDRELEPEALLAMGIRAHADARHVTVYLPAATAGVTRQNLADNGDIAITLERASDARAIQIKGKATNVRDSDETERALQAVFRAALIEQFALVGIPRATTRRLVWWPSLAVDVEVREVFQQTPGPKAGEPLPR
jgi:hypothetical protein